MLSIICFFFLMGSPYVTLAGLELTVERPHLCREAILLPLPLPEIPGMGHHACSNILFNSKHYTLEPWRAILGKVLFGRKTKFIFEFKRWSLVLPCHSKLPIVIVVTEGLCWDQAQGLCMPSPPCTHWAAPPACQCQSTDYVTGLVWYGAGDALMRADGIIAHRQWPASPLIIPLPLCPFSACSGE